ncbi:membrane-bound lytic murein transglycosylase MltF [Thioalbus denitrificans]|uniref:Membrane-bound lytic murein transglycosylase F n=1 Tax=Thioalbus denitrificans TaxID=547122 RepID=A0A369CNY5_9GAMM|nr:membrane-bound lytic murein transglycosylase MltF [Thioalbus denitrificans]RCX33594.1 membrane-bound lytic murein transglycosylase F [Thioalbus denitrificans]
MGIARRIARLLTAMVLLPLLLADCSHAQPALDRVAARGELRVITLQNAPVAFQTGDDGPSGMDLDLVRGFAEALGVEVRFITPASYEEILPLLRRGEADLVAGLIETPNRKEQLRFGPVYQELSSQVVYRNGATEPTPKLEGLRDGARIGVLSGSSHEELLESLRLVNPQISWVAYPGTDHLALLDQVGNGNLDYAVIDSRLLAQALRFYPELRAGPVLDQPRNKAWAFAPGEEDSLLEAAEAYFGGVRDNGRLAQLEDRYYGHLEQLDPFETQVFVSRLEERLDAYRGLFEQAAEETGIDWRLLAAMGYQESHWDPDAVSPTGVRGIMMLTRGTAKQLGIDDRTDPESSIRGGALYIRMVREKIPERIPEPDRTWMALAAYNIGYGHLEDARRLTQKRGGDPDRWMDVKSNLPLLSKESWYKQTRYGFARGQEPVRYVENIRGYYDLLVWREQRPATEETGRDSWLVALLGS